MAKEIVIWCEIDLGEDRRVPGREYEITVDGLTRTIDLCEACHEQHLAPMKRLLDEYGQPLPGKRGPYKKTKKTTAAAKAPESNSDGEYVCEDCGRAFSRPQALGRHRTSAHTE